MKRIEDTIVNGGSIENKLSNLSEEKKRYLKQMLNAGKSKSDIQGRKIKKRTVTENKLVCSQLQTEFWFRWKLFSQYPIDNIAGYVNIKGKLEKSIISKAFKDLINRHEVLRSKFKYQEEGVFVEIDNECEGDINFYDLTTSSVYGAVSREDIIEIMTKESSKLFDLSQGKLIRLRCYKTSEDEWYLMMVQHHIISDGTSTNILIKEMLNTIVSGGLVVNQELSVQFYDYIIYQNNKLENGEYNGQKDYWKKELKDCDMNLKLSESPNKNEKALFEGGRICFSIDKETSRRVEQITKKYTVTPFAFYMTLFRTLLFRYTKQDDAIIVIPIQGRNNQEVQNLIGCFLNMVSIRNQLNNGENFIDCVKRENKKILDALENQDIPFGSVVKELDIHSESMATSVYHIVFSYEGNVMKNVKAGNFEVEFDELFLNTTKSDLVLELNQEDSGLRGWFEYSTAKFSARQISLFKDAFLEMLKNSVADEKQLIDEIDFMTDAERELVLQYGTGNQEDWEIKTINRMFSEMVAKQPEKEALIDVNGSTTYNELEKISNRVAWFLRSIGVGRETVVALMMGKSREFFAALMGVIKAGGAFLPIEPSYPEDRIRYLMEDSGSCFLIYDEEYQGDLSFLNNVQAFRFSSLKLDEFECKALPEYNNINSLAYIIYTSGTTGKPKGVMVEHRGVSNLSYFFHTAYGVGPNDKVLQFSHIVFDACVWEMAISLLTGGTLCIVKKQTLLDVAEFVEQIHKFGVTVVDFSPQYWKQISKEDLKFRVLLTAGSEADDTVVRSAAKSEIYVNGYGPTENTVCISLWNWKQGEEFPKKIPIGKPMSNAQVYILDKDKLCGVGVTGEICVAGTGVARGYLNRPELTKERFTPNPFGEGKLYHTGDHGRWREDGEMEYAGRIDGQMKIRGYRVEAGEIEICLCKHEGIDASAVTMFKDTNGEQMLAAYLVLNTSLNVKQLDEYLGGILPFYMIPAKYYSVKTIPLNINGKTDYSALKKMGELIESGYEYTEPSTEVERKLAAIWRELLNNPNIGVNDSFFECGGDSIIILQVITRAAQEGINIELKSFYEDKTIAKIAKNVVITSSCNEVTENSYFEYEITHMQELLLEFMSSDFELCSLAAVIDLDSTTDSDSINAAVNVVLKRHDLLRSCFDISDNNCKAVILPLEHRHLLVERSISGGVLGEKLKKLVKEAQEGLSLKEGRLLQAVLMKTGTEKNKLLIVVHKLVCDNRSLEIIIKDLRHEIKNKDDLKEPIQTLSTYLAWNREFIRYTKSNESEYNRQKWHEENCSDASMFCRDFSHGTNFKADEKMISIDLHDKYAKMFACEEFGNFNITAYELLLAALALTLNKWNSEGGIVFLENSLRDFKLKDIDTSKTVGCFTSIYPFHYNKSFFANDLGECMKLVKNKLYEANQRMYDYIVCRNDENLPQILKNVDIRFGYNLKSEPMNEDYNILNDQEFYNSDIKDKRDCLIKLDVCNVEGKLSYKWYYSTKMYKNETIEKLAQNMIKETEALVDYCIRSTDMGITASDFDNTDINQDDLDYVLSKFNL